MNTYLYMHATYTVHVHMYNVMYVFYVDFLPDSHYRIRESYALSDYRSGEPILVQYVLSYSNLATPGLLILYCVLAEAA